MIKKDALFSIFKQLTPPLLFSLIKKSSLYPSLKKMAGHVSEDTYLPAWHTIPNGELKDQKIFVSSLGSLSAMTTGSYDAAFFESVKKLDLQGKVIFDIGSHIGFDALYFAKAVGEKGTVVAFEPNTFNRERFEYILTENKNLASRIKICPAAISNKNGTEEFVFSSNIDNGTSSGSFLGNADTIWEKEIYEKSIGFTRTNVQTVTLDSLASELGILEIPALIKIDVEGAEHLVMEGALTFIITHKPLLLIEIHSILNMLKVGEYLRKLNYSIELLEEESDGRCFISAKPSSLV